MSEGTFRDRIVALRQWIGEQLSKRDRRRGPGAATLDELAAWTGVDRSTVGNFTRTRYAGAPRADVLARIAQTCHVSTDWLLGLSDSREPGPLADVSPIAVLEAQVVRRVVDAARGEPWAVVLETARVSGDGFIEAGVAAITERLQRAWTDANVAADAAMLAARETLVARQTATHHDNAAIQADVLRAMGVDLADTATVERALEAMDPHEGYVARLRNEEAEARAVAEHVRAQVLRREIERLLRRARDVGPYAGTRHPQPGKRFDLATHRQKEIPAAFLEIAQSVKPRPKAAKRAPRRKK